MSTINNARKGLNKKSLADKRTAEEREAAKLAAQSLKKEGLTSVSEGETSKPHSREGSPRKKGAKQAQKSPKMPPRRIKTAHSEFKLVPFSTLNDAMSDRVSILAYHSSARKSGRKLVIALKAKPTNALSVRLEKLPFGSSMDNFDFSGSYVYLKIKDSDIKIYRKVSNGVLYAEYPCIPEQIQKTYEKILGEVKFVWSLFLIEAPNILGVSFCYSFFLMICGYKYIFFVEFSFLK